MSYGGMKLPADVTVVALGDHPWIIVELHLSSDGATLRADINSGGGIATEGNILLALANAVEQLRKRAAVTEEVEQYRTDVEAEAGT
jgi:hypothetical protein